MLGLEGDIVAAYLKSFGFVGIGRVKQKAKPVVEVAIKGRPLLQQELTCPGIADNADSLDCSSM